MREPHRRAADGGIQLRGPRGAENLPELVLGGATAYLAEMGVTVISCA